MPTKPRMTQIKCEECGSPKQVEARELKRGKGRFCSKRCAGIWRAQQPSFPVGRNQVGDSNPNWRGGRAKHPKGYVYAYAPDHPRAWRGYVLEHILVAEQKLGRMLRPDEVPHHKNGIRDDNRPENIQVMLLRDHCRLHTNSRARKNGKFVSAQ